MPLKLKYKHSLKRTNKAFKAGSFKNHIQIFGYILNRLKSAYSSVNDIKIAWPEVQAELDMRKTRYINIQKIIYLYIWKTLYSEKYMKFPINCHPLFTLTVLRCLLHNCQPLQPE